MTKGFAYRNYLLAVLLSVLAFNFVDRTALGLVFESIKSDLRLNDTELGFLSGIAFALFYSIMGIPIARWADRGNRVAIISVTTALWSIAVVLCGLATSFLQLLLIRVGVAVGEAGCIPSGHSLIADYFPRAERPRAAARYMLGGPLSLVIGYFLAGWLNQLYGWRATFVLLGVPGIGLAALTWLTLSEPRRRASERPLLLPAADEHLELGAPAPQPNLLFVCRTLWRSATFRHLLFSFSILSFFGSGIAQWQPTFFVRSYGMTTGALGTWLAVIFGIGGIVGISIGGEFASRYAPDDERLQLRIVALVCASLGMVSACTYLFHDKYVAFGWMTLAAIGGATITGPLFATVQTLVPQHLRATAIAFMYLFANLIGMGMGPLAAGYLSDRFQHLLGNESLRYALLILCPGYLWGAWHLWLASTTVSADLRSEQGNLL